MNNPIDILAGLLFLVIAYYLYQWQPEIKLAEYAENPSALPKIKEVAVLIYLSIFASWFYRRVLQKSNNE